MPASRPPSGDGGRECRPWVDTPRIAAMVTDRDSWPRCPAYLPTGGLAAVGQPLPRKCRRPTADPPGSRSCSTRTGQPLALMDGTSITTLRTSSRVGPVGRAAGPGGWRQPGDLGNGSAGPRPRRSHGSSTADSADPRGRAEPGTRGVAPPRRCRTRSESRCRPSAPHAEACADADLICAATHSPNRRVS
jgi:hypothetical protein